MYLQFVMRGHQNDRRYVNFTANQTVAYHYQNNVHWYTHIVYIHGYMPTYSVGTKDIVRVIRTPLVPTFKNNIPTLCVCVYFSIGIFYFYFFLFLQDIKRVIIVGYQLSSEFVYTIGPLLYIQEKILFSIFLKETLRCYTAAEYPLLELIFFLFSRAVSLHGQLVIRKIEFLTDQTMCIYILGINVRLRISRPNETKEKTVIATLVSFNNNIAQCLYMYL